MDNISIIYDIDHRGADSIYHFLYYVIAGLRLIEKENEKINIYISWFKEIKYYDEFIELFKDKFNILTKQEELIGKRILNHFGEPLLDFDKIAVDGYKYVVNKLQPFCKYSMIKGKYVFVVNNEKNEKQYQITNNNELTSLLSKYNIETVEINKLNLEQTVKLFQESEVIIGTFDGGLSLIPLCNSKQKIIELVKPDMAHNMRHYKVLSDIFKLQYYRFTSVSSVDSNSNITVKLQELENLLIAILPGSDLSKKVASWWDIQAECDTESLRKECGDENSETITYVCNYIKHKGYNSLVDLGCGFAQMAYALKKNSINIEYTGVDNSSYFNKLNRSNTIHIINNDVRNLTDINDSEYDYALMRHVIEYQPHYMDTLNELVRVAKREIGIVFFIKPGTDTVINYDSNSGLFKNIYSKTDIEFILRNNPKVRSWIWINNNARERTLHVYMKAV